MNILMLNYEFPPIGGGAAPVTLELCRHLVKLDHDVDVVTMRYKGLPASEVIDGVTVYRTWAVRKRPDLCRTHEMASFLVGAFFKTLGLSKKRKYDIIHCHFIIPTGPLACLVARIRKVPFLITCHGSDVPGYNPDRFRRIHWLIRPFWRSLVHRADMLVSPSQALRTLLQHHCPDVNVRLIPNGISLSRFRSGPKEKSILLCSRLLPRKGFQYVLRAVHDLKLDWQVNIVGDGPFRTKLEQFAQGSKTPIRFWGWLDQRSPQFRQLYETGSIFVFPSEAENFPTVLLEAMSAGMAIITSTAGGCPEVVGPAALLVEPGDVEGIRSRILELTGSQQRRKELSEAALHRVEQYSWPGVTKQYVDCYERLCTESRNR
ncbi:MAG: glycosyltransferase family 4 protein [Sedimentisphaerales bacterium]|nr:glycosyltransferase family 4 protein [Sedimentisphaerales bacterium]